MMAATGMAAATLFDASAASATGCMQQREKVDSAGQQRQTKFFSTYGEVIAASNA